MATYTIDPAQLTQSAGKVRSESTEIMTRIRAVMTEVQNSRNFWTGRANSEYEQLMTRWNKTASDVHKALDATVAALNQAASEYDTTEQSNASRFAG